MRALSIFALLAAGMSIVTDAAGATTVPSMRVDGTAIIVTDADGVERRGNALEGAELDLGALGTIRIRGAVLDPEARFVDDAWLLDAQMRAPGASAFTDACIGDGKSDRRMMIYSGYLDPSLRYVADKTRFSITCVSGVEAKCLRWGYMPWRKAPIGDVSLAPYFEACVRLARADYCGDSQPTTREGTAIDVYDRVGVMQRTPNLPDFAFEAGWTPSGATCVHHARIPENLDLADLPARCPRLANALIGKACDEATAERQGALIITRSVIRKSAE